MELTNPETGTNARERVENVELSSLKVAVLIPCYNEEVAIAAVVKDFQSALPTAAVYVYDNNSSDRTVEQARAAGAVVRSERLQGKGNVVRRMFADIEADVYMLVDGDDTYDAASAPLLISHLIRESLDMVNGARVTRELAAYRPGHKFGNYFFSSTIALLFGKQFSDVLSGYRVLSRRFVKSFPALSAGFEIETELTVHALELRMPIGEVSTPYKERPSGSTSKLRTFRDGFGILKKIILLIKEERPLLFFSFFFLVLSVISITLAWPIASEFIETGLVPRFPTAILSTGMMLLAFLSLACGLILDNVTLARREMRRMWYLATSPKAESGLT